MSYLHCPTCSRAYNIARDPVCPSCPRDVVADIVDAARALARAIERATSEQLLTARHALRGEAPLRGLLAPAPLSVTRKPRLLERMVLGLRGLLAT